MLLLLFLLLQCDAARKPLSLYPLDFDLPLIMEESFHFGQSSSPSQSTLGTLYFHCTVALYEYYGAPSKTARMVVCSVDTTHMALVTYLAQQALKSHTIGVYFGPDGEWLAGHLGR